MPLYASCKVLSTYTCTRVYIYIINHNHPYPRSLRAVEFVTDGFCAFHVGNLPHPVACFQPHTAAPSGGPMGSESQPKCSDPNRFPKMAAFLLQFARSSMPDEWLLRLTFCCFYIMETLVWPPWTFADQVGRVWQMENCDPERGKCMGCCVVSLWTSIHMVPGVCCWTSYLSLLKPRLFDFFCGFIQNLMFYWFLIYAAPHHLVAACLSIEQLLKICGDSDHADPRPETVGQPRIDDLAEILFSSS